MYQGCPKKTVIDWAMRTDSLEPDAFDQESIMNSDASNVDEALRRVRIEFKKIGVQQHCRALIGLPIAE
jgi:hypothetical protein